MPAKAPYNFVPLNKCVIAAQDIPDFDKFFVRDRYSGYIELNMETKTPMYIRSQKSDFFSINNRPKIPGSSIRGMVRTLVETASFGKFSFYDNKRLYYRAVGDTSRLGQDYRKMFVNESDSCSYKFSAGIMKKKQNEYKIYPSKIINNTQIYRIDFSDLPAELRNITPYEFKEVYFKPEPVGEHIHRRRKGGLKLKYAKINSISLTKSGRNQQKGYLIVSGAFGTKKHMHWVINEAQDKGIIVEEEKIYQYKNDFNRDEKFDVLKILEKNKDGVPVFYIMDDNQQIKAFGHTGFFRLPYELAIGDHIPENLKLEEIVDFAEAIFGKEGRFATRVFFEDAELVENQEEIFLEEAFPQILATPKPTTFQHYLEQEPDGVNTPKDKLSHWNDSSALIRGYKFYWHRKTFIKNDEYWKAKEIVVNKSDFEKFLKEKKLNGSCLLDNQWEFVSFHNNKITIKKEFAKLPEEIKEELRKYLFWEHKKNQYTIIRPVKPGIKFKSRVRFENLSREELGALLFVLDLPEKHYHKIGMGKPLGLGSISIKPVLFLIDRQKRYKKLFAGNEWELSVNEVQGQQFEDFKKAFEKYVIERIYSKEANKFSSLWDFTRMKELKAMLNWENTNKENWLEKTRYMMIEYCADNGKKHNEFKERPVLPRPSQIVSNRN
ncbi:MAG: TIGR03986 family CRISPR-associated RAMP protein [Thermosyntropha sp.]|nr:TIGR03986 family CRISPR-associated RAMP protein [Thermosyntropha sp.]